MIDININIIRIISITFMMITLAVIISIVIIIMIIIVMIMTVMVMMMMMLLITLVIDYIIIVINIKRFHGTDLGTGHRYRQTCLTSNSRHNSQRLASSFQDWPLLQMHFNICPHLHDLMSMLSQIVLMLCAVQAVLLLMAVG